MKPDTEQAGLIICERQGPWAMALAGQLPPGVPLREVRSLAECLAAVERAPASLIAIEIDAARAVAICQWLIDVRKRYALAQVIALGGTEHAGLESTVRELGAVDWVVSTRQSRRLGAIAKRHFGRLARAAGGARVAVWQGLPWSDAELTAD